MYKRKIISALIFSNTPSYSGRSFLRSRLEGLEYQILFSFIEESKKILKYKTGKEEQRKLILNFGKIAVLVDDMQDKSIWISNKDMQKPMAFIKKSYSKNSYKKDFLYNLNKIIKNQKGNTLKDSEEKGGAFALCLIYLLNPINITPNIAKAFYFGGAWGQIIDDYADGDCDEKTLIDLSLKYERKIKELIGNENAIIPFAEDLVYLAKISHLPFLRNIFGVLNNS